jgi:hypothetical protein
MRETSVKGFFALPSGELLQTYDDLLANISVDPRSFFTTGAKAPVAPVESVPMVTSPREVHRNARMSANESIICATVAPPRT